MKLQQVSPKRRHVLYPEDDAWIYVTPCKICDNVNFAIRKPHGRPRKAPGIILKLILRKYFYLDDS